MSTKPTRRAVLSATLLGLATAFVPKSLRDDLLQRAAESPDPWALVARAVMDATEGLGPAEAYTAVLFRGSDGELRYPAEGFRDSDWGVKRVLVWDEPGPLDATAAQRCRSFVGDPEQGRLHCWLLFGMLAPAVQQHLNLACGRSFGESVFRLAKAGILTLGDEDTIEIVPVPHGEPRVCDDIPHRFVPLFDVEELAEAFKRGEVSESDTIDIECGVQGRDEGSINLERLRVTRKTPVYQQPDREGLWVGEATYVDGYRGPCLYLVTIRERTGKPVLISLGRNRVQHLDPFPFGPYRPHGCDWHGMPLLSPHVPTEDKPRGFYVKVPGSENAV